MSSNMLLSSNLISSNYTFASVSTKTPTSRTASLHLHNHKESNFPLPNTRHTSELSYSLLTRKSLLVRRCQSTLDNNPNLEEEEPILTGKVEVRNDVQEGRDWTTSILLFVLWGVLIYYVFNLSPNQTPTTDMYFLKKLLNLKGDDGFQMNEVLVSLWYIMGLWPLVYSMILLPTGRSSNSKIPIWPFLVLSCFGGAYALLPYFVLWKPPPPPVDESELSKWPLNVMDSKVTAGMTLAVGFGLFVYAAIAGGDVWREFYQYFRESKFIHVMSIDFTLLSAFAPFWVYNDMTARKWYDKGSWLLPLSVVPLLGPTLYLFLRPTLSEVPALREEASLKQE